MSRTWLVDRRTYHGGNEELNIVDWQAMLGRDVAANLMGWRDIEFDWIGQATGTITLHTAKGNHPYERRGRVPDYTRDAKAALDVLELLRGKAGAVSIWCDANGYSLEILDERRQPYRGEPFVSATLPLVICHAAIAVWPDLDGDASVRRAHEAPVHVAPAARP